MTTLWDERERHALLTRLDRLTADTPARWGRFACPDMLAHVNDAMRMALGDLTPLPKKLPLRYFPLKQLAIYVLPFAKGLPTAPELIARKGRAVFPDEVKGFRELLARVAGRRDRADWPPHPAFGVMSRRDWGVLGSRHIDHHFRQFGV
ncbi:MAG: DUF1569 domain-containing protein [Gemmatimonadales bacterium]|nr:DUF1569 domain-containing protein [Gemmatimonadales bacterium]